MEDTDLIFCVALFLTVTGIIMAYLSVSHQETMKWIETDYGRCTYSCHHMPNGYSGIDINDCLEQCVVLKQCDMVKNDQNNNR